MLILGSHTNDLDQRITIPFEGLLHHTLVVGQSGSGKSFFVARLVEEILLRTRARVCIIDPNGDFRNVSRPTSDGWSKFQPEFERFARLAQSQKAESFDEQVAFRAAWAKRRFTFLVPGRATGQDTGKVLNRKLLVHWDSLEDEQRQFLLNVNPLTDPKVSLGIEAATENVRWMEQNKPFVGYGMDLRSLENSAEQFGSNNISLREYEYAKVLNADDWSAVRATIKDLLSRYSIWWSRTRNTTSLPPGVSDYIDGPFHDTMESETYWDALTLSLDSARPSDTLLAVEVALSRLWNRAKSAWRKRSNDSVTQTPGPDERVPTFIVVDEAHNFAPEHTSNRLRARVADRLIQIASEGRKYGLYLILATQRPTKLHRALVPECENSCILRIQSQLEVEFASKTLGIPPQDAGNAPSFTKGQCLFVGRWVKSRIPIDAKVAPARTTVGGGGLSKEWTKSPIETSDYTVAKPQSRSDVRDFVQSSLKSSSEAIALVGLAHLVREEFPQTRDGSYFGHETFKGLLQDLHIPNLRLDTTVGPGYAYLDGLHRAPAVRDRKLEIDDDALEAVLLAHELIGLPILSAHDFGTIIEELANEVQLNEFNLTDVSRAVRDKCKVRGTSIGRSAIAFVIKGILFSGHRFDPDLPQSDRVLSEAFASSVLENLKRAGASLTAAMESKLTGHLTSAPYEATGRDVAVEDESQVAPQEEEGTGSAGDPEADSIGDADDAG